MITNSSSLDVFVPTKTNAEWSAFLSHLPSGVTTSACSPDPINVSDSTSSTLQSAPVPSGCGHVAIAVSGGGGGGADNNSTTLRTGGGGGGSSSVFTWNGTTQTEIITAGGGGGGGGGRNIGDGGGGGCLCLASDNACTTAPTYSGTTAANGGAGQITALTTCTSTTLGAASQGTITITYSP